MLLSLIFILSCSRKEEELIADYTAPQELPVNLVPGTPLNDRILKLYKDFGVIVYADTIIGARLYKDLVSEESLQIANRRPPHTEAALLYVNMIEDEFIDVLPTNKRNLIFRNFYLFENKLSSGTNPASNTDYISYVWYNSNSDLTVGGLNMETLDTIQLKQTFFYGLSNVLRNRPQNTQNYYQPFIQLKTNAGVYYWQVTDLTSAYKIGFLSDNQNLIKSDQQDFDLFAAWAVTTAPQQRDSILNENSLLRQKYNLVTAMFRQEGILLNDINNAWQMSPYNPLNN